MPVRPVDQPEGARKVHDLSEQDRDIIGAFVRFANARPFKSEAEVNTVFWSIPRDWAHRNWVQGVELVNINLDRETARRWLGQMMTQRDLKPIIDEINERFARGVAHAMPMLDATSHRIRHQDSLPNGVEGWMALGAMLIFNAGLRHRIERCHYKGNSNFGEVKCQNFVFSFPESRRPKLYCSDAHRRKQEVVRVGGYRQPKQRIRRKAAHRRETSPHRSERTPAPRGGEDGSRGSL